MQQTNFKYPWQDKTLDQNTRKEMWHKDSHKQKIGKNLINIRHKKKNNKIEKISHKHKKK